MLEVMKPTLEQVAALANVSKATASRALNNSAFVSEELRRRVLEAARTIGYELPKNRQHIPSKDVGLLLVLVTDTLASDWYFVRMAQGIEEVLREHGRSLTLVTATHDDIGSPHFLESIKQRQMEGLIVGGGLFGSEVVEYLAQAYDALVVFDRYLDRKVSAVIVDHFGSLVEVIRHFVSLGHRRIGMINGPEGIPACDDKFHGYRSALEMMGLEFDERLVARDNRYHTVQGGYDAALALLRLPEPPTAVFASDDLMAYGAIQAAESLGLRVPKDFAVIGYGDVLYAQVGVPVTSLSVDFTHYGRLTARMLLDLVEKRITTPLQILLRASLVIRETCGARGSTRQVDGAARFESPHA